jgi:hypothetical protein
LNDSQRDKRLQNVYSARSDEELAGSYDEWAQDYEDDMLSLGYAIPAVAAGFVGRHVHPQVPCSTPARAPACSEKFCACSATRT